MQDQKKESSEQKYLKQLFPEIQQRKSYAQKQIMAKKLKDPIIVRIQPIKKLQQKRFFATLCVERHTKVGQIIIIIQSKLNINGNTSIYLFTNKKTLSINHQIGEIAAKNKEEDGILYISYAEHDVFG